MGKEKPFFSVYYSAPGVYAVEADKYNMDMLLSNLSAEVSAERINVLHAAAYSEDTTVYMQVKEKAYNTAITGEVTDMPVRAICMDTLCTMFNLDKIGLLKIDIEGSEEALFSENTAWLDKVNMIVVEIHAVPYRSTCEAILRNNGFVIDEPGKITSSSSLLWARRQR